MPRGPTVNPAQTAAMDHEVAAMEQRLAQLKATMSAERERRSAAQQANPSGSQWRSARTDMPVKSSKYVDQVLSAKPKPPPPKQQDSGATAGMGPRQGGGGEEGPYGVSHSLKPQAYGKPLSQV